MKQKASLLLMEQLIMILVFALVAALCLRLFVASDRISRETARQDRAVALAQNCGELVKATGGDVEKAAALLGMARDKDGVYAMEDGFQLQIQVVNSLVPGLGQAQILVLAEGEPLFSLTVAWQEVEK